MLSCSLSVFWTTVTSQTIFREEWMNRHTVKPTVMFGSRAGFKVNISENRPQAKGGKPPPAMGSMVFHSSDCAKDVKLRVSGDTSLSLSSTCLVFGLKRLLRTGDSANCFPWNLPVAEPVEAWAEMILWAAFLCFPLSLMAPWLNTSGK